MHIKRVCKQKVFFFSLFYIKKILFDSKRGAVTHMNVIIDYQIFNMILSIENFYIKNISSAITL